ncbi:AI-2E family transporter [Devosia sp. YIM 151766]|uniref:AI-2E family transporter n=1 Tax=Devosia sp. YIM 151766 TaxID=3017325 RepID=UPI00255C3488|nr:AI-2E family transporter [Devosia sp. YIM 151766]WIY52849.1 AI-2E family transporter [Devosia sp. YIM 151766]
MVSNRRAIITGVLLAAGLALAWQVSTPILLIFAGILVACVLDAAVRALARIAPWPRPLLLAIVSFTILVLVVLALSLGGVSLWRNIQDLLRLLVAEIARIYGELQELGLVHEISRSDIETMVTTFFPDPGGLFNQASSFFGSTLGIVSNAVIIIFLGLFFAIDPRAYRDGVLLLLPQTYRPRISAALSDTGEALRGWMVTQLAMMILIGTLVFTLLWALGVPNAPVLGLLAGALNFIPFLGPIFSAVPVLLTLAAQDTQVLILGAIGLFLIQNLEGYILTPMLQQRIIRLSPAWSLSIMTVLGTLFGIMGIALATPIYAVGRMLTLKLYVEPREDERAGAPDPIAIKE